MKTAVIIKGNPRYIENNKRADLFYEDLKNFLISLNFKVSFDSGEPYTQPNKADVWIGHSRGADRLRFADPEIKTISIGSTIENSINNKLDNFNEKEPNDFHFILSDEMKEEIRNRLV